MKGVMMNFAGPQRQFHSNHTTDLLILNHSEPSFYIIKGSVDG